MAICESCGSSFTPSLERTEVTSLRILCSNCEEKRRAEKAQRASGTGASTAPKAVASPGSVPKAQVAGGGNTNSGSAASTTIRTVGRAPVAPAARANNVDPASKPAGTNSNSNAKPGTGSNAVLKPAANPARAPIGNSKPPVKESAEASSAPAVKPASSGIGRRPSTRTGIPSKSGSGSGVGRRVASSPPSSRRTRPSTSPSEARELHGTVAKKLLHKPVRGKTDPEHGDDYHPDVAREIAMLRQRDSKVMTIAWIACGVLVLIAAGFGLAAKMRHDNDLKLAKDHRDALDGLLVDARKMDIKSEQGARNFLTFLEDKKGLGWESDTDKGGVGGELSTMLTLAKATIETEQDKAEQMSRLSTIEATLRDATSKDMNAILQARRSLNALVLKDNAYGDEFKARVQAQVAEVDKIVLQRLRQEAKTLAGGGPDKTRAALTAYSKAEDESTNLLDRAMKLKDEAVKKYYTDQFKELMEESNAYVASVFDEGMINSTAWTELLTDENKKHWQNYGLQGFRIEGGKLEAIAQKGGTTLGLLDFPDQGTLRDFTLDMEFTLTGQVDALFRLGKRVDNTVESWNLSTTSQEPLKAGQTYTLQATFIGSKLIGTLTPADVSLPGTESTWTKSRKGAIGFQMHDGAELRITRMRIRQLRGDFGT